MILLTLCRRTPRIEHHRYASVYDLTLLFMFDFLDCVIIVDVCEAVAKERGM